MVSKDRQCLWIALFVSLFLFPADIDLFPMRLAAVIAPYHPEKRRLTHFLIYAGRLIHVSILAVAGDED